MQDVLALPDQPFPPLDGVTECPSLRPNGTVLNTPGYDAATRLFYEPASALVVPEIPTIPSQGEAQAALRYVLDELLVDFPFCEEANRVNMVACLLTPIVRPAPDKLSSL